MHEEHGNTQTQEIYEADEDAIAAFHANDVPVVEPSKGERMFSNNEGRCAA